jgi:DNA-binding response OmpR family regulator
MSTEDHILIADDDSDFVLLLRTAFEYAGFEGRTDVVSNGLQAIEHLKAIIEQREGSLPCLSLLDLGLPRCPGVAVLHWIREQSALAELPVVLMTGIETGTEPRLVAEFGADDWLVKPFGFNKLVLMAHDLCTRWSAGTHHYRLAHY